MSQKTTDLASRSNERRISRRRFCPTFLGALLILCVLGCSTTKNQKKKKNEEFDVEESEEDSRDQSSELSDYVAQAGRGSKEKKKTTRGETFLLSDKAKEIYANTER